MIADSGAIDCNVSALAPTSLQPMLRPSSLEIQSPRTGSVDDNCRFHLELGAECSVRNFNDPIISVARNWAKRFRAQNICERETRIIGCCVGVCSAAFQSLRFDSRLALEHTARRMNARH